MGKGVESRNSGYLWRLSLPNR